MKLSVRQWGVGLAIDVHVAASWLQFGWQRLVEILVERKEVLRIRASWWVLFSLSGLAWRVRGARELAKDVVARFVPRTVSR
jgi:hypothetical protein